ncbi:MAG: 16S rRNA (adenine(1518)-N(6)/adenine(1519)-N(6))-dimethyltransferase RsmA [Armatimonadetes bacterium]|nr:16S rRNA (adenine(1518)-N(6)/adenine(1519)-N(6))-dimethyltransferase RsmA [Armatimonadota bacterium]
MATPAATARLLRAHGLRPRQHRGQHFMVSRRALDAVLDAAALDPGDVVLEVGAGLGTLTAALARRVSAVAAVEVDRALIPVLRDTVGRFPHVRVVLGDIMDLDPAALLEGLPAGPRKVVANPPYYLASLLMVRLLETPLGLTRLVLTVQREVAERIVAPPGGRDYGLLSVLVQFRAAARIAGHLPRSAFYPPPEVESAVVTMVPHAAPPAVVEDEAVFLRVVRAAFGQRRKTLRNALRAVDATITAEQVEAACRAAGVDPGRRGETLSLEEFAALARVLAPRLSPPSTG